MDPKLKIDATGNGSDESQPPVKKLVMCLMYSMLSSRPDSSFAVCYFSQFQYKNSTEVWKHLKKLLRYLKGTTDMQLVYTRKRSETFLCYSDWGGDPNDIKSFSGYLTQIFGNSVFWVTRKQNCIALLSTEAELIALCSAIQEILWFRKLLGDMKVTADNFKVFEDSLFKLVLH
ncbi:hypothetical protein Trydic_g22552 [Trypoxylus dichotomus]